MTAGGRADRVAEIAARSRWSRVEIVLDGETPADASRVYAAAVTGLDRWLRQAEAALGPAIGSVKWARLAEDGS